MGSVNKVILIGNLGHDPELKTTKNGKPFCRVNVATHERTSDSEGEDVEKTTWHMVHVFGKSAEWASRSLRKGARVFVEARLDKIIEEGENGKKDIQYFLTAKHFTGYSPPVALEMGQGQGGNFIVPNA